jgi:predicted RNase H-like HicB family nuclease
MHRTRQAIDSAPWALQDAAEALMSLKFAIELEQENDGRWIAEIPALPGVMVYGKSKVEAVRSVQALALHVLADRLGQDTDEPPERELVVCLNSPL